MFQQASRDSELQELSFLSLIASSMLLSGLAEQVIDLVYDSQFHSYLYKRFQGDLPCLLKFSQRRIAYITT